MHAHDTLSELLNAHSDALYPHIISSALLLRSNCYVISFKFNYQTTQEAENVIFFEIFSTVHYFDGNGGPGDFPRTSPRVYVRS